ncbi:MAG: 4Fe-4S binding protein [Bacteroidales bacterium]|nr:4Fe-4S binding protein [Bacteroidales bacterium]MDD3893262.1 4Fe-4S binding protein [Bacteroidales bacterium]
MDSCNGFIFDYSKCVGCHACLVACYNENQTVPPISWRTVNHFNKEKLPLLGFIHQSIACNHCIEAPCLKSCPSGAYSKDTITGAIIHDADKCIGCKYCTWACPFDAPKYNEAKGIIEKCNFCNSRLKEGKEPACTTNCPTGALSFGRVDTDKPKGFGISKKPISPRINTIGDEVLQNIPSQNLVATGTEGSDVTQFLRNGIPSPINAKSEWPLALFSFIGSIMVGWFWSGIVDKSVEFPLWVFILLGSVSALISVLHLGKPLKAYLSIVNIRTSWLAREILSMGLFAATAFAALITNSFPLLIIGSIAGLLFLICIEMVYSVVGKRYKTHIHSANTILTASAFFAFFANYYDLLLLILVIKSALFIARTAIVELQQVPLNTLVSFIRLLLGFVLPIGIIAFSPEINYTNQLLILFILIAELIDRILYYNDIEPERPMHFERELVVKKD